MNKTALALVRFVSVLVVLGVAAFAGVGAPQGYSISVALAGCCTSAPGVWSSSINLQNTSNTTATVVISFYKPDGTPANVPTYTPSPLGPNGAVSIYVPALVSGLTAGQYSAVVSSDQLLVSTVNTGSTNNNTAPWTLTAYSGASSGGTNLYFPGLYNNYFGFASEMVVQNAGSAAAQAFATFYNTSGAAIASASLGTIQPSAAQSFAMSTLATTPALPSGNTAKFAAVVTTTGGIQLVGVSNFWRTNLAQAGTGSYAGYTAGSSTVYAPALYNNYFSFVSSLTIQNVGTSAANVTLTYGNGATNNVTLQPGASIEYYQPADGRLPSGNSAGVFSAKATTVGGSIVGQVNVNQLGQTALTSYNTPLNATNQVLIPNVNKDYFGFFTAVTVQNTSSSQTVTVNIAYPGSLSAFNKSFPSIGPGQTVNIIHLNTTGYSGMPASSTSAIVTSTPAQPLVAVAQTNSAPGVLGYNAGHQPGDYLLSTSGVNQ